MDARPLANPWNGIGTYLRDVLSHLQDIEDHDWFLYNDRPADYPALSDTTTVRHGQISGSLKSTAFAQRQFSRWAKQDQCDLFWSPRHQLPLQLPPSMPAVLSIHDLVFRSHPKTMREQGWLLERLLTPASMRRATTLLASSASVKQALGHYYPQHLPKTRVARLSSSLHEQPETLCSELSNALPKAPYCVFSGSLEPRKNVDRLLAAFEQVKLRADIPHHLVLVSGGGWRDGKTLATIKRLEKYVHLFQKVSEIEKAQIVRGADFVALPSLHEGFGIPIAEGIKLGKPILTSNNSSMPEVAGAAGVYVNPLDERSIATALERLCSDAAYRKAHATAALKIAGTYGWHQCAEQTLAAFHAAIQPNGDAAT